MASIGQLQDRRYVFFPKLKVPHLITTADWGDMTNTVRAQVGNGFRPLLRDKFGTDEIIHLDLRHGSEIKVITPNSPRSPDNGYKADGLLVLRYNGNRESPPLLIAGTTADCPYVLLRAENQNFTISGFAHSGWRGASENIAAKALDQVMAFGFEPGQIRIGLWGGICARHYEVDLAVKSRFPGYEEFFVPARENHWYLNLRGVIERQLHDLDIGGSQIEKAPFCSFSDQMFYSLRRAQGKKFKRNAVLMAG